MTPRSKLAPSHLSLERDRPAHAGMTCRPGLPVNARTARLAFAFAPLGQLI